VISQKRSGLRRWSLDRGLADPALFTSTSILPERLSTAATIASNASGCARSADGLYRARLVVHRRGKRGESGLDAINRCHIWHALGLL
jgi:hypothetical protein